MRNLLSVFGDILITNSSISAISYLMGLDHDLAITVKQPSKKWPYLLVASSLEKMKWMHRHAPSSSTDKVDVKCVSESPISISLAGPFSSLPRSRRSNRNPWDWGIFKFGCGDTVTYLIGHKYDGR